VLRRPIEDVLRREDVPSVVFGYTLVGDFLLHAASGDPSGTTEGSPVVIGPCIVTPDELDPLTSVMSVRVNGEGWAKGNLNDTARALLADVALASREERLSAGEAFASAPFEISAFDRRIWPGAEIELEAEGIGVLRNRLGRPSG
jgi:2-keto-4-pentenoate hydratase/2-oxohepta-3-ene-1,7-dioic acid hydratase in catechol pathway